MSEARIRAVDQNCRAAIGTQIKRERVQCMNSDLLLPVERGVIMAYKEGKEMGFSDG